MKSGAPLTKLAASMHALACRLHLLQYQKTVSCADRRTGVCANHDSWFRSPFSHCSAEIFSGCPRQVV